ncbi:MAG: dephospho-CoA kinase [Rhodospirillales bacterium]|nr:dephospho-CoA kinase [Rhodospirillales bacterium]
MRILGLTGGMGMGKSTLAAGFRRARIPVFDADAAVHRLYAPGGAAVAPVLARFPEAAGKDGGIDRARLRAALAAHPDGFAPLEAIMHPLVRAAETRFLARARRAGAPLAVLDIPLLLETGGARRVDHVLLVSAPAAVQAHRLRLRRRMRAAEIATVLARQMPDRAKRRLADSVIPTGLSRFHATMRQKRLIAALRGKAMP